MSIVSIKIKNFRSLRDVTVNAEALTVFVGCNDEGKSNLLRALDLFFNGNKSGGYEFDWEKDFCAIAKTPKNKAEQIEIVANFSLPTFNVGENVSWRQLWRKNGFYDEEIKLVTGDELPQRSKAYSYLKSIRYEYVPAIKDPEYFQRLLSSMHDMLDATVQKDIRTAAASFTKEIRKHTTGILSDLESQLALTSDISLPTNLRRLFSDLEFRSEAGGYKVGLSQRGDGIKVRHIPVILKWLAEQANHLSAPGKPRTDTIWGYEEPENNLETRKCFDLANFFIDSSSSIQTFLTTHSPVFYSVFNTTGNNLSIVEVKHNKSQGTFLTQRNPGEPSDVNALHSSTGFMDLIEPHIKEWKLLADQIKSRMEHGFDTSHPTIFVEGPSDKVVIEALIKKYHPEQKNVRVACSTKCGGGHAWVKDSLVAWQHSRTSNKAVGIFDSDEASKISLTEFSEIVEKRNKSNQSAYKHRLKPYGIAAEILASGIKLPVALEEISPIEIWHYAKANNWLELRPNRMQLFDFNRDDIAFNDWVTEKLSDHDKQLITTYKVKDAKKEQFSKFLSQKILSNANLDFSPIRKNIEDVLKRLSVVT